MTVIQINDDQGRPRLELQVDPSGNPGVWRSTPSDGPGVSLSVNRHGNGISVSDAEGKPCIMLGVGHAKTGDPRGPGPQIDVLDEQNGRGWSVFDGPHEIIANSEPEQ